MKKSLIALVSSIIVLSICAVAYPVFSLGGKTESLDVTAKVYVDQTLPLLLADMTTDNFFKYAAKGLINSAPKEDFDFMFDWFSRLGPLKKYEGAYGETCVAVFSDKRKECSGEYSARVEFKSGPAIVRVMIIMEKDGWKINGISIESTALMRK
ncbi:hypothetical protein LJC24_00095 [Desulfococcaceae bacterium OttesenSCG-928-F15]|nr:hypothetical protein [Desulfococcaceae bacterium OttesenSCG-928-F15]